jgi:hypothetical protein
MQKIWEVLDDQTGAVRITITADSAVQGVTISNTPNWLYLTDMDHISTLLSLAGTWLTENLGA